MSFTYYCPNCKHKLTVGDDWDGVQTECPHCQATITITREKPSVQSVEPESRENEGVEETAPQPGPRRQGSW